VQSAWHRDVIDECRVAFLAEMQARHISHIDVFEVPGSFENPIARANPRQDAALHRHRRGGTCG
jgi:6,7-dimethyl-8-ribityllumazine synthase